MNENTNEKNSGWIPCLSKAASKLFTRGKILAVSFIAQFTPTGAYSNGTCFQNPGLNGTNFFFCTYEEMERLYRSLLQTECNITVLNNTCPSDAIYRFAYKYDTVYGRSVFGFPLCNLLSDNPVTNCTNAVLQKIESGMFTSGDGVVVLSIITGVVTLGMGAYALHSHLSKKCKRKDESESDDEIEHHQHGDSSIDQQASSLFSDSSGDDDNEKKFDRGYQQVMDF
jgi:hypothetical protein